MKLEKRILDGCRKGKRKHQKELYEHFYAYGIGICYRYAYNREDAQEILNDSFMKIFKNIDGFNEEKSFLPWFRKIIINTAIDFYKTTRNYKDSIQPEAVEVEIFDTETLDCLDLDDLMGLLNELPEMYRLIFNLYEMEGYSHEEIAKMLGIGSSTSRSNLTRAKRLLRLRYKQYYAKDYERNVR